MLIRIHINILFFYNGERIEADVFYRSLYSFAKNTIIIIDDYIGIKTLEHLKACNKNIQIIIFTDNVARPHLAQDYFDDYINDTGINIVVKKTNNTIHDRLIIIDYEADNELIYLCGPSSKDAGNKIASIVSVDNKEIYHPIIEKLIADSKS